MSRSRPSGSWIALLFVAAGCGSSVDERMSLPDPFGASSDRPDANAEHKPAGPSVSTSSTSSNSSSSKPNTPDADAATSDAAVDDDDAATPASDAGTAPVVVENAKRVFETSNYFSGDLQTEGWARSGLEGGDALCNSAALAAGIGGMWRAWLSAPGTNAKDRIADVSPWYLVDRTTLVFDKKVGLGPGSLVPQAPGIDVGPLVDIEMNEHGVTNSPINDWTGTQKNGLASPFTCNGWTTNQPNANEGLVGIGTYYDRTWWTDGPSNPCSLKARLICFEQ